MATFYNISNNGQQVAVLRGVKNSSTIPLTSVALAFTIPTGVSVVSAVPRNAKGSYSPSTKIWTVGNLAVAEEANIDLVFEITDKAQAYSYTVDGGQYFGFQVTLTASSAENPDINLSNNTKYINIVVSGACASQPSDYYCPPVNNFAPPTPCAVADPFQNITGNVLVNDKLCDSSDQNNGCTTKLELVGSPVNCVINAFDLYNGNYSITVVDALDEWSFQYRPTCVGCNDGKTYSGFSAVTVSGKALFQGATIDNYLQASGNYGQLVDNSDGTFTFTPAYGSPVTFNAGWTTASVTNNVLTLTYPDANTLDISLFGDFIVDADHTADFTADGSKTYYRLDGTSAGVVATISGTYPIGRPYVFRAINVDNAVSLSLGGGNTFDDGTTSYAFVNPNTSVTIVRVSATIFDIY